MTFTNTYQRPFQEDDELDALGGSKRKLKYSSSILRYSQYREIGHFKRIRRSSVDGLYRILRRKMFEEKLFDTGDLDKIFCSEFLDNKHVMFGTKCNRLMILNTQTKKLMEICNLKSSPESRLLDTSVSNPCGIHAMAINPSRSRLATSAANPNDTAVFELPALQPYSVGDVGHDNWIFDVKWLDDRHYVSGAKDSQLILWDAEGPDATRYCSSRYIRGLRNEEYLSYTHTRPKHMVTAISNEIPPESHGLRALEFNAKCDELITLTLAAEIQQWDVHEFQMVTKRFLKEHTQENVCLASNGDMTAIGSKAIVSFVDNNLIPFQAVPIMKHCSGVRSLSLRDYILTVGTGHSNVAFIDIRTYKYIEKEKIGPYDNGYYESRSFLNCSRSRNSDTIANDSEDTSSAIFAHCYDPSGLRLFTAGGPLSASSKGCYASLWQ